MNSDLVGKLLLGASALAFAGFGLWMGVDPLGALGTVDVGVSSSEGQVELHAMYGGLQLGMAAFLAWCLATERVREGVMAATLALGGLGGARAAAYVALQPESSVLPVLIAMELGGLAAGLAWLSWTREA